MTSSKTPRSNNINLVRRSVSLLYVFFMAFIFNDYALGQSSPVEAFEKQDYKTAVESWDKMLEENPELKDIHYNQGNARFRLGELDEAISSYEQALSLKDRNDLADVYYNMGNAWLHKQDLEKAREFYKRALKLRPDDKDAKANLELMNLMPPPPPQEQNSQQNEDDQEKQDNEEQQEESQSENQNDEKQDEEQQKSDEQQDEDQSQDEEQQNQDEQQEEEEQQPSEGEEDPNQEDKLNAQQLLDALKDRETENMREQIRLKTSGQDNEKDW